MSYVVPTFNLLCNIFDNVSGVALADVALPPRVALAQCNLAWGRRVNVASTGGTTGAGIPISAANLLLPALTDIRGPQGPATVHDVPTNIVGDYVEVPAGSGRIYIASAVDDIGKGFANEHRTATLFAVPGSWPVPFP